jgi:hypothetical protein
MLRSETLRIQQHKTEKFGYLPMMVVGVLGVFNTGSFCELVVSDLHLSLKDDEIRMFVILRLNHEFMEYMSDDEDDE